MAWATVAPSEEAQFDQRYRSTFVLTAAAWPFIRPEAIRAALTVGTRLAGGRVQVDKLEIYGRGSLPQDMKYHSRNVDDWGVRVTWRKISAGTPALILAGAVVAVIAALVGGWMIVAKFTERELMEVGTGVAQTLRDTLFSPGFIVAAMIVAVVAFKRKG
jgi:uncharacterized protein YneF (UPF0154 family)